MCGWIRKIELLILVFCIAPIYTVALSQPLSVSSNGIPWSIVSDESEKGYIIYHKNIDRGSDTIEAEIQNFNVDHFTFEWKQKANHPGLFGNMRFFINGENISIIDKNDDYIKIGTYKLQNGDELKLEIAFKKGGEAWIRFPRADYANQDNNTDNQTPYIINLSPNITSPQAAGTEIEWIAEAKDPDDDQLLFRFILNNTVTSDWSTSNKWTWKSNCSTIGKNNIQVQIIDQRHSKREGYDSQKNAYFKIIPNKLTQIFNVSTSIELQKALSNNSSNKEINLVCNNRAGCEFKGNYIIRGFTGSMEIKPHNNNKGKVILNGSNNDYIFAIDNSKNIHFDNLYFNNSNNSLILELAEGCSITNCRFYNFLINGVYINKSALINIVGNDINSTEKKNNITGIYILDSNNTIQVIGNSIDLMDGECKNNNKNCEDILLENSINNNLSMKDEGIVADNSIYCGIVSHDNKPNCQCSYIDGSVKKQCNCDKFKELSKNNWNFKC
jgi:hypothetical protein